MTLLKFFFAKKFIFNQASQATSDSYTPNTLNFLGSIVYSIHSIIKKFNKTNDLTKDEILNIIKKEIYLYGPIIYTTLLTEEFVLYKSGIWIFAKT